MVYADDVTHIVTEEGIANLLLCRDKDEREHAIRGVAGYTDVGRGRDAKMVQRLRERGVIRRPEDLGIDPLDADRNLLAARSIKDLVAVVRGPLRAAVRVSQLVRNQIMENLSYRYDAARRASGSRPIAIVGVVASGNLEVLVERVLPDTECRLEIKTAADGFGAVWERSSATSWRSALARRAEAVHQRRRCAPRHRGAASGASGPCDRRRTN